MVQTESIPIRFFCRPQLLVTAITYQCFNVEGRLSIALFRAHTVYIEQDQQNCLGWSLRPRTRLTRTARGAAANTPIVNKE